MSLVSLQKDGPVAVVTFNRPPVNALSVQFLHEIDAAVQAVERDDEVRAVLFRSDIPGIFIAGADLHTFKEEATSQAAMDAFHGCFNRLERLPKPTVAAVSGHALGGGCEFTLACDFRLMIDDGRSTIGLPEVTLGIFPGAGGTQRLPRIVGQAKALDIIMHGRRLGGQEALAAGLVHELLPADGFDEAVRKYAEKLASGPTKALAAAKAHVLAAFNMPIDEGLQAEAQAFLAVRKTKDAAEGIEAFLEKRQPRFVGE